MLKSFSKEEKSWIFYDWANSAYILAVTTTIFQLYFKSLADTAGVDSVTSTAYWGYANSIGSLIVAILAPILGTIADYKNFKKRFFIFFVSLGVSFTTFIAILPKDQWIFLLVFFILTTIGFSGANIFYDSFLVDVTTKENMDKVSSYGYGFGYIGSTIPFFISIIIIFCSMQKILPISFLLSCKISFIITALWWGLFTIPLLKHVKQKHYIEPEPAPIIKSFKRIFFTLKNIKKHKALFLFLTAYFFYIDGVGTIIRMATSYATDLGVKAPILLTILLITQIVACPFSILYGKLAKKFSTKKILNLGIITYIIICIYAYFMNEPIDFLILSILVGTAQGGIQGLSRSYFGKLIPKENSTEFFGFYNICGKFAAVIGPLIVGVVAQWTGKTTSGVFSVIFLFIIGLIILNKVPDENINK